MVGIMPLQPSPCVDMTDPQKPVASTNPAEPAVEPAPRAEESEGFYESGVDEQYKITAIDHAAGLVAVGVSCFGSTIRVGTFNTLFSYIL